MRNKNLTLLLVTLVIASCSANKKNIEANSSPTAKAEQISEATMFSVTAEEIKKSEATAHVIYFDTNKFDLTKDALATLNAKILPEAKNDKTKKVVIEAHCDERGSSSYNKRLSAKRANAVKEFLVKNGVKVKIKTVGYGESKPVALGHDEESWSKNRRAVTISIKK